MGSEALKKGVTVNVRNPKATLAIAACAALCAGLWTTMQAQQPAAAGRGGGRGGTAVNVFNAADTDKDGSISRDELRAAFTRWLADADTAKSGAITQEQLATALNAAFPQPVFPAGGAGRG